MKKLLLWTVALLSLGAVAVVWHFAGWLWALFTLTVLAFADAGLLWLKKERVGAALTLLIACLFACSWGLAVILIHNHKQSAEIAQKQPQVSLPAVQPPTPTKPPIAGQPSGCPDVPATPIVINGIEQPLVPPRPDKQHCNGTSAGTGTQTGGTGSSNSNSAAAAPAPITTATPAPTPAAIEIKPISGDWGKLQIRSNGCTAPDPNTVICKISVMDPVTDPRDLWLTDVEGVDNHGTKFVVSDTKVDGGTGVGTKLQPGYPSAWTFTFSRDQMISNVAFTIDYSWNGVNPRAVGFIGIPVVPN